MASCARASAKAVYMACAGKIRGGKLGATPAIPKLCPIWAQSRKREQSCCGIQSPRCRRRYAPARVPHFKGGARELAAASPAARMAGQQVEERAAEIGAAEN
eukprot:6466148-Prymnesium_polylepis.1